MTVPNAAALARRPELLGTNAEQGGVGIEGQCPRYSLPASQLRLPIPGEELVLGLIGEVPLEARLHSGGDVARDAQHGLAKRGPRHRIDRRIKALALKHRIDELACLRELVARQGAAKVAQETVIIADCRKAVRLVELDAGCQPKAIFFFNLEVIEALNQVGDLLVVEHWRTPQEAEQSLRLKIEPPRPAPGEHDVIGPQASHQLTAPNGVTQYDRHASAEIIDPVPAECVRGAAHSRAPGFIFPDLAGACSGFVAKLCSKAHLANHEQEYSCLFSMA